MKKSEINNVEFQEPLSIMEAIEDKIFNGNIYGLTEEQQERSRSILKEGEDRNKKKSEHLNARYEKLNSWSKQLMNCISDYRHHESWRKCSVFADYLNTMIEDFSVEVSNSVTEYKLAKYDELLDQVSAYELECRDRMLLDGRTPTVAEELAQKHGVKFSSSFTDQRKARYQAYKQNVASAKKFMNKAAPIIADLDKLGMEGKISSILDRVSLRETRLKAAEKWTAHCRMELEAEKIKLTEHEIKLAEIQETVIQPAVE